MKKLLFLFLLFPFLSFAQDEDMHKPREVTQQDVQDLYDSLPKQGEHIRWQETVELGPAFTKAILEANANAVFARLPGRMRNIDYIEGKTENKLSGLGTFSTAEQSESIPFSHGFMFANVDESREVDFNIDIVFKDGAYTYTIFDVITIRERKAPRSVGNSTITETSFDQVSLEEAYKLCLKSRSKKTQRILFYETVEILTHDIELLKLTMKRRSVMYVYTRRAA